MLAVACIYIVRLFSLQVLNDDYKQYADGNAFLKKTQYPSRGLIYDRTGKLLVFNQPAYDVMMIVREVRPLRYARLLPHVGITREQFDKRMEDMKNPRLNPGYSSYTPQDFHDTALGPGLWPPAGEALPIPRLLHPEPHAAPVCLPPWRPMCWATSARCRPATSSATTTTSGGDYTGDLGIERSYEQVLRGEKGGGDSLARCPRPHQGTV